MRMQPQLTRLLADDLLSSVHPIDPILKEIVVRCVDESGSWADAATMISQAFGEINERVDLVQSVLMSTLSQFSRT